MLKPLVFTAAASPRSPPLAPAHAQGVIKIGEINSYKAQPAFLEPYKKGMELAVDEINAAGGVNGKKLELITRDDNANPGDAVRVAEELVSREKVDADAGTFLSNTGLAVADFAKQKKFFFLAGEPLTDKITWQGGNQLHLPPAPRHLHAGRDAGARSRQAEEEALGRRLPQLRIRPVGRRRVQELLKAAQPDVEFVAEQAPPLGKVDAGAVVQALADAKPDAIFNVLFGADLSKFVREGNTRGLFKDRDGGQRADRRARVPRPAEGRDAQRLDRHRLPVVRHPDARAQGLLPGLPRKYKDYPRLGSVVGYSDDQVGRRRHREGQEHRHREAGRGLQGPAGRHAVRQDHLPRRGPPVDHGRLRRQDQERRRQGRDGRLRLPRRRQVPADDAEVKKLRAAD